VVEGESGESYEVPLVPTWGMVLEYLIKSCTGHPTTPKGGSKEYRNGPWYKPITIEQKWSHFKKWFDNALKNTQIANPARNAHIEKARGLGRRLG